MSDEDGPVGSNHLRCRSQRKILVTTYASLGMTRFHASNPVLPLVLPDDQVQRPWTIGLQPDLYGGSVRSFPFCILRTLFVVFLALR